MSRVHIDKLTVSHLHKKSPKFRGIRSFIAIFTTVR